LAALRHAGVVRVDAGGASHEPRTGGKICWCRRAKSH
jgi:hypothetical protein